MCEQTILIIHTENSNSNQGPSSNDAPQKPDTSPSAVTTTQQASKQAQTNSHSPSGGGDPVNSVSINQSSGGPPITKGLYMHQPTAVQFPVRKIAKI